MSDFLTATRTSYDRVAVDYDEHFRDGYRDKPVELSVLSLFASVVDGPVLEVGCGTGHTTAELVRLGLHVSCVDLSPGMVAVARSALPGLDFAVGSMLALPYADDSFGGVVAFYSTIHVPDDLLPAAMAELARVLRPGGHLLLAFQVGDEPLRMTSALGHEVALDFHRRQPSWMAELLADAGVPVRVRTVREADASERTPHAMLLAQKP
ncbi:class I SAM-dependent methyltransferase [Actinophytocola oryzae]|uniref:class I SAM-dependent methyltransferase n=1 Tax=Actinophytocola oryzae TaxID=502181 RepID=UPI001FBA0735|nr:class I SAM-dependent methyltransferase [Actinophytocola oryzae]